MGQDGGQGWEGCAGRGSSAAALCGKLAAQRDAAATAWSLKAAAQRRPGGRLPGSDAHGTPPPYLGPTSVPCLLAWQQRTGEHEAGGRGPPASAMRRCSSGSEGLASQVRGTASRPPPARRRATTQRESPVDATSTLRPTSSTQQAVVPDREASKPACDASHMAELTSRKASRSARRRRRSDPAPPALAASSCGRRVLANLAAERP